MTWNDAGSGASGLFSGGFGGREILLVIGMVVALAVVSGLGILARIRDRASEQKARSVGVAAAPIESDQVNEPADEMQSDSSTAH